MAWPLWAQLNDSSGNPVYQTDAASLTNLRYSMKLPGGCAVASFSLVGGLAQRFGWVTGTPRAVELVINDAAGTAVWRGRFMQVTVSPAGKQIDAQFMGYWATVGYQLLTKTWAAGTNVTARGVIRYCRGLSDNASGGASTGPADLCPLLASHSDSQVGDPALNLAPGGGQDLVIDHQPVRSVIQRLIAQGDGANQWYCSVNADKALRVFQRSATVSWQVWVDMLLSGATSTYSIANVVSDTASSYTSGGTTSWKTAGPSAAAKALLGNVNRYAVVPNPFAGSGAAAQAYANQYAADHDSVVDMGSGLTLGPRIYDTYGRLRYSYEVQVGDTVQVPDLAVAQLGAGSAAANPGIYYVVGADYDVANQTVTLTPDTPNPASLTGALLAV